MTKPDPLERLFREMERTGEVEVTPEGYRRLVPKEQRKPKG